MADQDLMQPQEMLAAFKEMVESQAKTFVFEPRKSRQRQDPPKKAFIVLLQEWPHVLEFRDLSGRTLLHHAIVKHANLDRFEDILRVSKQLEIAKVRAYSVVNDRHNRQLPLHMMLDEPHMSPKDVEAIMKVLEANPAAAYERDDFGPSPGWALHKVLTKSPFLSGCVDLVHRLMALYPAAVKERILGNLALHMALDGKPALTVIRILQAFPSAASKPNSEGMLPLHYALIKNLDSSVVRELLQAYPSALLQNMSIRSLHIPIMEYVVTHEVSLDNITMLLEGGNGSLPKCVACARACLHGSLGRSNDEITNDDEDPSIQNNVHTFGGASNPLLRSRIMLKKVTTGEMKEVVVPGNMSIADLKVKIQKLFYIDPAMQKLTVQDMNSPMTHTKAQLLDAYKVNDYVQSGATVSDMPRINVDFRNVVLHKAILKEADASMIARMLDIRPEFAFEFDHLGMLPLHLALMKGTSNLVVKKLLSQHPTAARVRSGSTGGEYPLTLAMQFYFQDDEIIFRLLQDVCAEEWSRNGTYNPDQQAHKYIENNPLLNCAIVNGHTHQVIKKILESGYPLDVRDPATGYSALETALVHNVNTRIFEEVLAATEAKNYNFHLAKGPNGSTLMHVACQHNVSPARIRRLCEYGEHILAVRDMGGKLPIHVAVQSGLSFDSMRELIIRYPESMYHEDGHGRNALQLAVISTPPPGVIFELARNFHEPQKVKDPHGRSLLELAVNLDAPLAVVHELLEAAPDLINEVNLINGRWPSTTAGKEVRRLALLPRKINQVQAWNRQSEVSQPAQIQGFTAANPGIASASTDAKALPAPENASDRPSSWSSYFFGDMFG